MEIRAMPSNFEKVESISRLAGQDLSTSATQYRFGVINANAVTGAGPDIPGQYGSPSTITVPAGNVTVNAVNGAQCTGIILGKAQFGQPVEFGVGNRLLIVLGGTVAAGAQVQSDANGAAITQTGSGHIMGIALEAGVAGDQISMQFSPRGEA
jgi:hypothetical protein